jgi:threonine dehydrogenase-like Zn-dependent dehydrogenase
MGCKTALAADLADLGPFRIVLDAAGTHDSVPQAVALADTGGVVALPGVASPIGGVCIDVYETIARRNLRLQGVWVSDARHLFEAVSLVQSGKYALAEMVSHRFPLSQANEALAAVRSREAVKAVLIP